MNIALSTDLLPDNHSDEINLQTKKWSKCGFAGIGAHEETIWGKLDSELINHRVIMWMTLPKLH